MSRLPLLVAMTNGPFPHNATAPTQLRYTEDEVARILRLATEGEAASGRSVPSALGGTGQGLTLSDLHRIGEEVGIGPERLTVAAQLVHADRAVAQRADTSSFELTTSFPLVEAPSEETWGRIVAVLRDAFEDTGAVTTEGSLRRWRSKDYDHQDSSRIEARLEPDPHGTGWRLLLTSRAVDHTLSLGGCFMGLGAVIAAVPLGMGLPSRWALLGAFVVGCGGVIFTAGYRWRGTWRERREQQFRAAAASVSRLDLRGARDTRDEGEDLG